VLRHPKRAGFTDTFVVHLPYWRFRVVADGYEPGEWTELDVPQYIRQARRAGPRKAKLVVPVSLHKRHFLLVVFRSGERPRTLDSPSGSMHQLYLFKRDAAPR
jgi:hypothetical protein